MSNDVKILLWKYTEGKSKLMNLVGKAIVFFTGYDYTHVAVYVKGNTYDSSVWQVDGEWHRGIRKTTGELRCNQVMVPTDDFSPEQIDTLKEVAEAYHFENKPYNIMKLLVLALIWPTRKIWRWLHWVPFNHEVLGEVCSGFVDEVFLKSRIDLFPYNFEGYTVPGQYAQIGGWDKE